MVSTDSDAGPGEKLIELLNKINDEFDSVEAFVE